MKLLASSCAIAWNIINVSKAVVIFVLTPERI